MVKKNILFCGLTAAFLFAVTACSESGSDNMSASKTPYMLKLDKFYTEIGFEEGNTDTIRVEAPNTSWEVIDTVDWITITPTSGKGSKDIVIKVKENPSLEESRSSVIGVRSTEKDYSAVQELKVYQEKGEPYIIADKGELVYDKSGGIKTLQVKSNVDWEVSCAASWVKTTKAGNSLSIYVENNEATTRKATLHLSWNKISLELDLVQNFNPSTVLELAISNNGQSTTLEMVHIDGGTFTMGDDSEEQILKIKNSKHEVTLSDFYIASTEVTQHLWLIVMGKIIRDTGKTGDNYPICNITRTECIQFIGKLNEMMAYNLPNGMQFCLPSEAQWEFAAIGGLKSYGYLYAGSDDPDEVAWLYRGFSNDMQPVALKKPNELGLYDMSGNVEEWCYDRYGSYPSTPQIDPTEPLSAYPAYRPYYVVRGDSWASGWANFYVTSRKYAEDSENWLGLKYKGFRLALK